MKKNLLFLAICAAGLAAFSLPLAGQTSADHIRQGDESYAQFNDAQALESYLLAVQAEPDNYEALWKTARAYFDLGDLSPAGGAGATEKQRELYNNAVKYSRQAIRADANGAWGHFFLSAAMGKYVLTQGKKEQINGSKTIKAEIEKAIELDPENDLAYHALGRWNRRMAEIGGASRLLGGMIYGSIPKGSFEESEKNLVKAIELKPNYTNHHLELGRTYLSLKKKDLAVQEFQKVLELPDTTSKCPLYKKEAETELAKLKKKGG
jgi:tetratricopeptide (TPR) repeat protein